MSCSLLLGVSRLRRRSLNKLGHPHQILGCLQKEAQTCVAVLESGVGGDSDSKAIPIRVEVFQEDSRGPPAVRLGTNGNTLSAEVTQEDSRGPTTSLGTTQGTEKLSPAVVTMEKHGHLAEDMKATYRRWKALGKPKNQGQNREGELVTNRIKINKRRVCYNVY